jgi:hypothetical protein
MTLGAAPVRSWVASSAKVVSRRWCSASIAQCPRSGSASRAGLARTAVRRLDRPVIPRSGDTGRPGQAGRIRQSTANPFCGGPTWVDRPMPRVQLTLPATSAQVHPPVTDRLEDARGGHGAVLADPSGNRWRRIAMIGTVMIGTRTQQPQELVEEQVVLRPWPPSSWRSSALRLPGPNPCAAVNWHKSAEYC